MVVEATANKTLKCFILQAKHIYAYQNLEIQMYKNEVLSSGKYIYGLLDEESYKIIIFEMS